MTRPGSGTYVAERSRAIDRPADLGWQTLALGNRTVDATSVTYLLQTEEPGVISLAGGYPHPGLLPGRAVAAAIGRAARRPDAAVRPPLAGIPALRSWFARSVDGSVAPEDVLVATRS